MRPNGCCGPDWKTASWISVDDTGARHKAANGVTTQIGNSHFTWFGTTGSKSRLNFLSLLRAGHDDYVVNSAALDYMRRQNLASWALEALEGAPDKHFAGEAAWQAHLDQLGLDRAVTPDPIRLATEGALWGSVQAHGLLPDTVIVSDDAGQFNVGVHALCRVGGDVATPAPHRPERADFASLHLRCPAFGSSGESFAHSSVAMDNPGWR